MLKNGFVKIYRSLLKWEWYDDIPTKVLFLHLLLTVNYEDKSWHGMVIRRGSRVASYAKLAREIRLTERQTRTAVKHLEMTGELTRLKTPICTVFTIKNYDKFQEVTRQPSNERQAERQAKCQPTDSNERKYIRIEEEKKKEEPAKTDTAASGREPPGLLPTESTQINRGGDF